MRMDYRIKHKDVAELGYYFIEREQEKKYLQSLNDELALRVGTEAIKHLPEEKLRGLSSIKREEVNGYLMENILEMDEMIIRIRKNYLLEIKNKRRLILVDNNIEFPGQRKK